MSAIKDLTGQRFGRLVVISRASTSPKGEATWKCLCDCGKTIISPGYNIRSGNTNSCGCFNSDEARKRFTTHNMSKSRLYVIWTAMKQRCCNPNSSRFHQYGGRGITICDKWLRDFQAFYEWSMANGYDENASYGQCTIDRIDNDKGYSPDNCRWVDVKIQNNNKSNNRKAHQNERN